MSITTFLAYLRRSENDSTSAWFTIELREILLFPCEMDSENKNATTHRNSGHSGRQSLEFKSVTSQPSPNPDEILFAIKIAA
jgi:hypothetical protein